MTGLKCSHSPATNGHTYPTNGHTVTRSTAEVDASHGNKFLLPKKRRYSPQYANIYFCRLKQLRSSVEKAAKHKFGPPSSTLKYTQRIVDVTNSRKEPDSCTTVIIGVVFRQMQAKPSILKSYETPSYELIPPPPDRSTSSYVSTDDTVFLEDENGRCSLQFSNLESYSLLAFTTGFILAIRGREHQSNGSFVVSEYTTAMPAPQSPLPELPTDKYICIMSSPVIESSSFASELFIEFLRGSTGGAEEETFAASIVHLLIAGNISGSPPPALPSHEPLKIGDKERTAGFIVEADRYLSALCSTLPVSVMPGDQDATNYLMPQQPFHRCLLPSSSRNANLSRVPNPFSFSIDGRQVLATSGQNVHDVALYEPEDKKKDNNGLEKDVKSKKRADRPGGEKVLSILKMMIDNRHIAPSCPDTLGSYPFFDKDPFVIDSTPHIFVAGCQKEFATKTVDLEFPLSSNTDSMDTEMDIGGKLVRLLSVPKFSETGQVVLVNLRTLDCIVREFSLSM